ncbi:MAG TPA: RHS repeat domain-containing protein, partial [Ktedonobacterales bacterium]|nr:RHS repeat domain-containing protein [Ktedonobacterales bacterium]
MTATTQTTTELASYTLQTSYNDAGQPTSVTYSDGEVFSPGYNAQGWLTSATSLPYGGSQVNLLTALGYSGVGGAAMHPTSATLGNGTYMYAAS